MEKISSGLDRILPDYLNSCLSSDFFRITIHSSIGDIWNCVVYGTECSKIWSWGLGI